MSTEYTSSADFTADLEQMVSHLNDAMLILQKPGFEAWMKLTDENYAQGQTFRFDHSLLTQKVKHVHAAAHRLELNLYELDEPKEQDNG